MTKGKRAKRKPVAKRRPAPAPANVTADVKSLKRALSESRRRQTATADVLKVISRSTFDLQTVLDTLVESAAKLCEADSGAIHRPKGDAYPYAAKYGYSKEYDEYMREHPIVPDRSSALGRAVAERCVIQIADVLADPEYATTERQRLAGFRTLLGVPLLREGIPIGVIILSRKIMRPFTDKQIELVTTFADQAVIAIENVRLFDEVQARTKELSESLEQQTATSEVLQVISSSPGELEPVFKTILENATRICEAKIGILFLREGTAFRAVALNDLPPEYAEIRTRDPVVQPHPGTGLDRLARTRQVVHIADMQVDPAYAGDARPALAAGRTVLLVPMLKDNELIGAISIYRLEVHPFTDKQIELLANFAAQAVIAIENTRLLKELRQRTDDLSESLEQQTATSDVLSVISNSLNDTQPVFDAIVQSGLMLFSGAALSIALRDGDMIRGGAVAEPDPARADAWRRTFPYPLTRAYMHGAAMLDRRVVDIPDVETAPAEFAIGARNFLTSGYRAITIMPMLRGDEAIGALSVVRLAPGPLSDKQLSVLKTFAAQAVIAIENTRLLKELRARTDDLSESLEQQTATSEVLQVISSSPGELEPVFQSMLENATRICAAKFGSLVLFEGDTYRRAALYNAPSAFVEEIAQHPVRPLTTSPTLLHLTRNNQVIHITDILTEQPEETIAKLGGARSLVVVPMLKEDELIGAISIYRQEVRPFTDKQIELVSNFAKQAVIAIENTRLLKELRQRTDDLSESLQQQTATSEVLRVISSSPGDLQPVFESMLENATRLCEASHGNLLLWEGDAFRMAAVHGDLPALALEKWRPGNVFRPGPDVPVARCAKTRKIVQVADLREDAAYRSGDPLPVVAVDVIGTRTLLAIPMLKEDELVGAIIIYRRIVQPFTDKQIELVTNFAAQAVIAIENTRLLKELRARTDDLARSVDELRALGDVSQAVNSTLDLKTVLDTIVAKAVQLSDTEAGTIYEFDRGHKELLLRSNYGMSEDLIAALRNRHIGIGEPTINQAVADRQPVQIPDLRDLPATPGTEFATHAGFRSLLVVPLLARDHVIGALVVRRKQPGEFLEKTVNLLKTFAAQSVLAIQNAHLFTEIGDKSRQLAEASQHKSQFLANMSHELRTPLNAILGYTELILDNIYGETPDKMRTVLERLQSNGKHLLGLINDVLDLSKIEAGELSLTLEDYSIKDVVNGVYSAVEPLAADKRLGFKVEVVPNLPTGHGDQRRLTQVLLNLVGNSIKFTDQGEVTIKASASNGSFSVAVHDTGPGISLADQAKIFEEFKQADSSITRKKGGTGLGLSISKRIIEMHGGRIWVESDVGKGSTFTFTIPVATEKQVTSHDQVHSGGRGSGG